MLDKGKILVVGGTGYIGLHTCLYLSDAGYTPIAIDDFSNSNPENFKRQNIRLDVIEGKAGSFGEIKSEIGGVIYLACDKDILKGERETVKYMRNINELISFLVCLDSDIPFVYSSSASVYGDGDTVAPVNVYGMVKAISEKIVLEMHPKSKIFRYFNVAGSDPLGRLEADPCKIESFIDRCFLQDDLVIRKRWDEENRKWAYPKRDFVSVWDVARFNVKALEDCDGQTHNIASGCATPIDYIVKKIGKFYTEEVMSDAEVLVSIGKPDEKYLPEFSSIDNILATCKKYYGQKD